ncbi:MAG: hypothetical protein JKY96_08500 [Phycisphaerales bacterium]|nr:hypothetical protein [Phycisphaerales bacterium]
MNDGFDEKSVERALHPAAYDDERLLKECAMSRGRGSGPGGQHRNKVQTQVTMTHTPSGVSARAGERRESEVNKRIAIRRLRVELALKVRVEVPDGEIRSALWRSRCKNQRVVCSVDHVDYSAMLAEALDVGRACGWDMKKAAVRLGVSMSQLVKLIAKHRAALVYLNEQRAQAGMHPLRG